MMLEYSFFIAPDLEGQAIEIHNISCDMVILPHPEVVKLMFSISNRVMRVKFGLQFGDECNPITHPMQVVIEIPGI